MIMTTRFIIPLPTGCLISSELLVCLSVADWETAAATPPGGGGGGTAVESGEAICGGLDTGAMAPPIAHAKERSTEQ